VEFEGIEYTVVALPGKMDSDDYDEGMDKQHDLKKKTSQKRTFFRETRALLLNESAGFRFGLPENAPGTIRRTLNSTNSSLPSQCQIKYSVTARIVPNGGYDYIHERKVSKEIYVLPKKEVDVPIDPVIGVSIDSTIEACHKSVFSFGKLQGAIDAIFACNFPSSDYMEQERNKCIVLNASKNKLHLCIGQTLLLEVNDSFRLLSRQKNAVWMLKLTEELRWEAQGRMTSNKETWNLHINNHAIPALIPNHDHDYDSLIQVHHTLAVYMTTKEQPTEYLASTGPIQVKIMSSRVGWDA
jgi:hypothetical protein